METEALSRGYGLPGQIRLRGGTNYPLVDFTNSAAKAYWQDGMAKLLRLGVAAFKLDRSEENLPQDESLRVSDGRTIREYRNVYPAAYAQAAYEIAERFRGDDFIVMPRAGYSGSAPDIGAYEYGQELPHYGPRE